MLKKGGRIGCLKNNLQRSSDRITRTATRATGPNASEIDPSKSSKETSECCSDFLLLMENLRKSFKNVSIISNLQNLALLQFCDTYLQTGEQEL
jgi:hypothetical protein